MMLETIRQQSREWLRQAREPLDHDLDPPFQLMLWGLDHGLLYRDRSYTSDLRTNVEYLAYHVDDMNDALKALVERPGLPEEPFVDSGQLSRAGDPMQASFLLLDALDSALTEKVEEWPPIYPKVDD
ncbi:MAG: hypothetical protein HP497_04955 [Nitrospira sp.]|nr:hypothetical protein [Nitrospira sp.]